MEQRSQNGWPVLAAEDPRLVTWSIPTRAGVVRLRLRNGSAGFLLAHFLLWFADVVEPLVGPVPDDWGWAPRLVRGSSTDVSNHASGTAADHNAPAHWLGERGTFSLLQYARIRARLLYYAGTLRHGIDYKVRADEMHVEIDRPLAAVERCARRLCRTPRGRRILRANPGQREVIWS